MADTVEKDKAEAIELGLSQAEEDQLSEYNTESAIQRLRDATSDIKMTSFKFHIDQYLIAR